MDFAFKTSGTEKHPWQEREFRTLASLTLEVERNRKRQPLAAQVSRSPIPFLNFSNDLAALVSVSKSDSLHDRLRRCAVPCGKSRNVRNAGIWNTLSRCRFQYRPSVESGLPFRSPEDTDHEEADRLANSSLLYGRRFHERGTSDNRSSLAIVLLCLKESLAERLHA
jgi:hypothetical protein